MAIEVDQLHSNRLRIGSYILLALIMRLLVMPVTMHIDNRFIGDLIQIAKVAQSQDASEFWYPPLFYYTANLYQKASLSFCPSVINTAVDGKSQLNALISDPAIFCTLWSLKFWYLLFDIGAAFILWFIFRNDQRKAQRVLLFWLFNPIIIYDAYFHGQFDLIPVFFTVLAMYFARKENLVWAAFFIGLAACFKNYAFLFLLPVILIFSQSWVKRFVLFLIGTVPYILLQMPYLTEFGQNISGYGDWFFKVGYDVGFGARVYVFLAVYAVLLWFLYHYRVNTFEGLWRTCFAILLVYFQFSVFDLHYWIWVVPFAALYWLEYPREVRPFYFCIGLFLLVLITPTPVARFLAPISPRFFLRLPSLMEVLTPYLPMLFIFNVVRSLLAGTCFYLAYQLIRNIPTTQIKPPRKSSILATASSEACDNE